MTDIDPRFLADLEQPNLDVWRHDVVTDDLPDDTFALVHTRLLLAHLSAPQVALQRMVAALKPGGWLVAEELDFITLVPVSPSDAPASTLFTRLMDAHMRVLESHGFDSLYGRRLSGHLQAQGLSVVETEGRVALWRGGSVVATILRLTFLQLREELMARAGVTAQDLGDLDALLTDPEFVFMSPLTVAAWGQRRTGGTESHPLSRA